MGAGFHGGFGNTGGQKEHTKSLIQQLPKNPSGLLKKGWKEITPSGMHKNTSSRMFQDAHTGLQVRYDKGTPGSAGFGGKDHYHVLNPNATGKQDYYLDINGNPVPKNSRASHIIP